MTIHEFVAKTEPGKCSLRSFTIGEIRLVKFQLGILGSFYTALYRAMFQADSADLQMIARGFPSDAAAVESWKHGDLAARLRALPLEGI